jgi:hypothetical protein
MWTLSSLLVNGRTCSMRTAAGAIEAAAASVRNITGNSLCGIGSLTVGFAVALTVVS